MKKKITKDKKKCNHCLKKLKLLDEFKCNCGNIYCLNCRYPHVHNCQSKNNNKNNNKQKIKNNNPKIEPMKIDKI
tara:strand:- start:1854 stop:2078 length:225 start_codon:yes stop_codon:yes gene_type:complete